MPRELGTSSKRKKRSGASSETTLNAKLSNEELLRQIKALAQELTIAEQSTNTSRYDAQAAFLSSPFIIKHKDKDVRLHAALCLVDILRVYAPDAPFGNDQMWDVFSLIISQLKGLEHGPSESKYKKRFYILESLALVRTFNICADLDFQDLILQLFKLLFSIVNDNHSIKEQSFMVEIMSPIFDESESIPQELLDSVLVNIVEPKKSRNPAAYKIACNLIQRTSTNIEPFIQMFFNSVLTLGKTSESDLTDKIYELILELNRVCSPVLLSVLPQLEFKLKSTDAEERLTVTKLLAQMFSDSDSELATQNKPLWNCYLGRFHDINVEVRVECVKNAKGLLQHPELVPDITEKLCSRSRDPDERVRQEVVTVTCDAAAENIKSVSDKLFDEVCERTRDKKWSVRGEAMMCLGKLYKRYLTGPNADPQVIKKLYWLPNKLIHGYYQNMVEDRLCVERVLSGCLVPVTLKTKERMKSLLSMYIQLDEHAVGAFNVLLKCQANVRGDLAALVGLFEKTKSEENDALMLSYIITLARAMPEPYKSQENLKKLQSVLTEIRTRESFKIAVDVNAGCPAVFKAVADIVVKLGARNPMLETMKALLDRAAPVMVDAACVKVLLEMAKNLLEGLDDDEEDNEDNDSYDSASQKGNKTMELLVTLSGIFPSHFRNKESYENILVFLKHSDQKIVNHALHVLSNVADGMETSDKDVSIYFQPVLNKLACRGTPQQAKYAMKSIAKIFKDPSSIFERIFTTVFENLEYDHPLLLSYLTTLAQVAVLAPSIFETKQKAIIRDFVVKELLVKDRSTVEDSDSQGDNEWCDDCDVTRETQAKIKGIKLMIKWLQGIQSNFHNSALPVLRLLSTLLANGGDLQNNGCVCSYDCSRLRLAASCGMLKLAQEIHYEEVICLENFQQLALIMQDVCSEVKTIFIKKLHRALDSLKLPLEYLGIFALAASDPDKDRKVKVRQMITKNVSIRKEYLKQHFAAQACSHSLLPEYAVPTVIHLLAHHPDFKPKEHESLMQFKEYLWFFMEPILSSKTENLGLLKKLIETVKQTKDAQNPEDQETNEALYTVCDLALGLIFSKASGLVIEEFPGQPLLPKKMFLPAKTDPPNTKSYLPTGFVFSLPGKRKTAASEPTKRNPKQLKSAENRKRAASNRRMNTAKRTKEASESELSEEESRLEEKNPVISKRKILSDRKPSPKKTVKQNSSRKSREPEKVPLKSKTSRTSPRKTPTKRSPRKLSFPTKRDAEDSKSSDVSSDICESATSESISPRKGKQKRLVNGVASPKKQTLKRQVVERNTAESPSKKRQTASPSKRYKSSEKSTKKLDSAKQQNTPVASPKVKKLSTTSPSKASRGTTVKRKLASPNRLPTTPTAESPAKNTRAGNRSSLSKRQKTDSSPRKTTLNVKRRTVRKR